MDKVKAWTDHVILHFWHCASSCKESETTSDEAALEIMKVCALSFLPQYRAPYKWVRGNLHLLLWIVFCIMKNKVFHRMDGKWKNRQPCSSHL